MNCSTDDDSFVMVTEADTLDTPSPSAVMVTAADATETPSPSGDTDPDGHVTITRVEPFTVDAEAEADEYVPSAPREMPSFRLG